MSEKATPETDTSAPRSKYGSSENGRKVNLGGGEISVDDDFMLATQLATIAVLNLLFPDIDERLSQVAANIYDEITKETN